MTFADISKYLLDPQIVGSMTDVARNHKIENISTSIIGTMLIIFAQLIMYLDKSLPTYFDIDIVYATLVVNVTHLYLGIGIPIAGIIFYSIIVLCVSYGLIL